MVRRIFPRVPVADLDRVLQGDDEIAADGDGMGAPQIPRAELPV